MAVTIRGSGQVPVQIVQTEKTDTFSTSSTSYVDITGLSVTITPSNSLNRILIFASINGTGGDNGSAVLLRNSTQIAIGTASGSRVVGTFADFFQNNSSNSQKTMAKIFLDSPLTTSAVTYKIQYRCGGSSFNLNSGFGDTDSAFNTRTSSIITVMEIAYA
jgi:hypothetical protein